MDERMRKSVYSTSNQVYGWRGEGAVDPAARLRELRERGEQDEETRRFNEGFWRSTSRQYGAFGYHKNKLCRAVEDLQDVSRAKQVLKHESGPVVPQAKTHALDLSFEHYKHNRKPEHKIYTTSANDVGAKPPKFDTKLHPHSNDFTKSFLAGMQRDCGLNTNVTKNRFC